MCSFLKEIVVCSCNILFDFFKDVQFGQATLHWPINYENVAVWTFWYSS